MNGADVALTFDCEGQRLVGVLSPGHEANELGVLIIVGGPQYRAGSHRQFVMLARRLAGEGFPVLRFDYRGMGDSEGDMRSFEHVDTDVAVAIDALLRAAPSVRRVALCGLCDGASAALLYLDRAKPDPRVAGLCLLNPWVRTASTLARTHVRHYYLQRLRERAFWLKLLRGGVAWRAPRDLFANLLRMRSRAAVAAADEPYTRRMARSWLTFRGQVLLLLSGQDFTAKEFIDTSSREPDWRGTAAHVRTERVELPDADHTLSATASRLAMENHCVRWLQDLQAATSRS
jgi:exosortase A-associated hydrolase 1